MLLLLLILYYYYYYSTTISSNAITTANTILPLLLLIVIVTTITTTTSSNNNVTNLRIQTYNFLTITFAFRPLRCHSVEIFGTRQQCPGLQLSYQTSAGLTIILANVEITY